MNEKQVCAGTARIIEDVDFWVTSLRGRGLNGIAAAMQSLASERDALRAELAELRARAEPVLDSPATVGAGTFAAGLPWRMVIEAAKRQYQYRNESPAAVPAVPTIREINEREDYQREHGEYPESDAVPDDVAKDAIGKIDQNSYTTGWNDCAQQIGDDRMPGIRYTAEYLRERVNTMRIKGLSMSVIDVADNLQQRLRGSFRSPRPASVTPRCTIPSCSPPTPRAAKMRNRIAIIAISAAVLSGCGWFDRKLSALTGEASKVCVDGVTYLQFTSGATVQLDRAGLPVACN